MDCSPPGSSVHGILQARILEWVAISFSRGSSWSRYQIHVCCIAGRFFTAEPSEIPLQDMLGEPKSSFGLFYKMLYESFSFNPVPFITPHFCHPVNQLLILLRPACTGQIAAFLIPSRVSLALWLLTVWLWFVWCGSLSLSYLGLLIYLAM